MKKCWMNEKKCANPATTKLLTPDGRVIGSFCREHVDGAIKEYREKLGEEWTAEEDNS